MAFRVNFFRLTIPALLFTTCSLIGIADAQNEADIGRQYHEELVKKYKVYEDERVTALGQRVTNIAGDDSVTFYLIDMGKDDVPNAFQIPDHIYVTKSLNKMMDDTSLTFILAHEMGHEIHSHGMRQMNRTRNIGIGALLLGALFGVKENTIGDYAIAIAGGALVNSYSREQEEEADLYGLNALHDMGIPFKAAADSFRKMAGDRKEDKTLNALFGSHPMMRDRITRTETAENWLKMRPVSVFRSDEFSVAVLWPYPGEKPMPDKLKKLKSDLSQEMTAGHSFTEDEIDPQNLRIWTRLQTLERLNSGSVADVSGILNVRQLVVFSKVERDGRLRGFAYDISSGKRASITWRINYNAKNLKEQILKIRSIPEKDFKEYRK